MSAQKTNSPRRCKKCGRLIATVQEVGRSYDKPRADRCYVAWSVRDLGMRPAQRKMTMTKSVKAMAKDLALSRTRERLAACSSVQHLRATKMLIDALAELGK